MKKVKNNHVAYECPCCQQRGVLCIGPQDFYDFATEAFGEYHTYKPTSLLPLPCQEHFLDAGEPDTYQEFLEWKNSGAKSKRPLTIEEALAQINASDLPPLEKAAARVAVIRSKK